MKVPFRRGTTVSGAGAQAIALSCLALLTMATAAQASAATNVLFILDSSGSMWQKVDGVPKTVTAKHVLADTLQGLPSDTRVGLMSYGHRRKGDCSDIEMVAPIGAENAAAIIRKVDALQPKGETPIAAAIASSASAFAKYPSDHNMIVLVTDGAEECHGDPCAAAKKLAAAGFDVHINVVGFNLQPKERQAVECIAREGHGTYYDAKDTQALTTAMADVKEEIKVAEAAPPPESAPPGKEPKEVNLLAPSQGGQAIVVPNDEWLKPINGKDDSAANNVLVGQEAVYAFKDEKPATFWTFAVLIGSSNSGNPKEIEVLAGDSPTGAFRSLGKFPILNVKMVKSPYQGFAFPKTTARYVKIRLLASYQPNQGWGFNLPQIRIIGKPVQ